MKEQEKSFPRNNDETHPHRVESRMKARKSRHDEMSTTADMSLETVRDMNKFLDELTGRG